MAVPYMAANEQDDKNSWQAVQDNIASESGVAIVLVEGNNSVVLAESQNSSICKSLQSSEKFASLCAAFCGKGFEQGSEIGKPADFKCHAGLSYTTVPINAVQDRPFVAIVGRAFQHMSDYRAATERALEGEWKDLDQAKLFSNIMIAGSDKNLNKAVQRLQKLSESEAAALSTLPTLEKPKPDTASVTDISELIRERQAKAAQKAEAPAQPSPAEKEEKEASDQTLEQARQISELIKNFHGDSAAQEEVLLAGNDQPRPKARVVDEAEDAANWRSFFNSLLSLNYRDACVSTLKYAASRFGLESLAWLEQRNNSLEMLLAAGKFHGQQLRFNIRTDDARLLEISRAEEALALQEKTTSAAASTIQLFPIVIGDEIKGALVVGDNLSDESKRKRVARFCKQVSSSLEILRLRHEVERQSWLANAVKRFNEGLKTIDTEDFWSFVMQTAAELLQAERGSLILYDEEEEGLTVKAAVGKDLRELNREAKALGERVAANVLKNGRPLVVNDVKDIGITPAPVNWHYKSASFICFPVLIGAKKIGILSLTDKVTGGSFDSFDLELLNTIAPQLAVAIDRASLKQRAGKYEQLSITDPLTGLLNRRYLEERLAEEIKRSHRHGYPMSFLMIDVDEFKSYNDQFLHTEGDRVLQLIAQCLKATLRGADVAARYGGEEFSILLPQTSLSEGKTIAERIRQRVEKTTFPNRRVTISMGVAACAPNLKTPKELIAAADQALYEAKAKGKNNVQVYQNLPKNLTFGSNVSEAS